MNLKRLAYLVLPSLGAAIISAASFYYSWKFQRQYESMAETHKNVVEKISKIQGPSASDTAFLVWLATSNREHIKNLGDTYREFGIAAAALAIGCAISSIEIAKSLKRNASAS